MNLIIRIRQRSNEGVQEIHAQISASTMKPMLEMDSENTASELFAKSVFIILAPKVK